MAKMTKKQRSRAAKKAARTRARRNPLGIPWWVWVGGGALALYMVTKKAAGATTSSGLTLADLASSVNGKMLGQATNIQATLGPDGTSVKVTGTYGGNTAFEFIKANSLSEAFALSQKLSPSNPALVGAGLTMSGLYDCIGFF